MKVALVAAEVFPFSKTGGLADVTGALPARFAGLGAGTVTISPLYRSVRRHPLERTPIELRVPVGDRVLGGGVARSGDFYFIEYDDFFDRDAVYGPPEGAYADNDVRFVYFCRAALELLRQLGAPDVLHAHDWHAGLIPIYLRTLYAGAFPRTRSVFTIHNMAYQGQFESGTMALTGLEAARFNCRELEFYGRVNFLKAGIVHADALTTVSPTYAGEIQSPGFGCGLEGVLRERAASLHGILNGADYSQWSPEHDPHIAARYSVHAPAGKARCKAALQRRCGWAERPEVPLVGMVGRLAEQKGVDLFLDSADALAGEDVQFVILGVGDPGMQDAVLQAGQRHPGKISVHVAFDNALAHQIEAGSDVFLMPSRYEPCGLNQIYSLKYGTVPVVRSTGGLADTVEDGVTGFVFRECTGDGLRRAVGRALRVWADRGAWRRMMAAGMRKDFSWEVSAQQYLWLFESIRV